MNYFVRIVFYTHLVVISVCALWKSGEKEKGKDDGIGNESEDARGAMAWSEGHSLVKRIDNIYEHFVENLRINLSRCTECQ